MKFKVGDFVYEPFKPHRVGKVLNIYEHVRVYPAGTKSVQNWVSVKWPDLSVKEHWEIHLKDFNKLIADHQKKLNTHLNTLKKAQLL